MQVCSFVSFRFSFRRCRLPDAFENEVLKSLLSPLDRYSNSDFREYRMNIVQVFLLCVCVCVCDMIRIGIGKLNDGGMETTR